MQNHSNYTLYNLTTLYQLCNNNQLAVKSMLAAFCTQTPQLINHLGEALKNEDGEFLSKTAHKLKSSIDYLQIESLKQIVREVERKAKDSPNNVQFLQELVSTLQKTLTLIVEEIKGFL